MRERGTNNRWISTLCSSSSWRNGKLEKALSSLTYYFMIWIFYLPHVQGRKNVSHLKPPWNCWICPTHKWFLAPCVKIQSMIVMSIKVFSKTWVGLKSKSWTAYVFDKGDSSSRSKENYILHHVQVQKETHEKIEMLHIKPFANLMKYALFNLIKFYFCLTKNPLLRKHFFKLSSRSYTVFSADSNWNVIKVE